MILCLFVVFLLTVVTAYPPISAPNVAFKKHIFIQGVEDARLSYNGSFLVNTTAIHINQTLMDPYFYNFTVSPCRLVHPRIHGCTMIDNLFGDVILTRLCESPADATLPCQNPSFYDGYDATSACDVITPQNSCRIIRCVDVSTFQEICKQFGVSGQVYFPSIDNLGLECAPGMACNENDQCMDARGAECPTTVSLANSVAGLLPPGNYSVTFEHAYGASVLVDAYEIIASPVFESAATPSNSFFPLVASPGAPVWVNTALPAGASNVRYVANSTEFIDTAPLVYGTQNISVRFTYSGKLFVHPLAGFSILFLRTPSVFSLCPNVVLAFTSTTIAVIGQDFYNSSLLTCMFGDVVVPVVFVSDTLVRCTVSPASDSQGEVQLRLSSDAVVFSPVPGLVQVLGSCSTLKPNSVPLDAKCVCQPGFSDAGYACIPCLVGSFQPLFDQQQCIPCDGTQTTRGPQSINKTQCVCKDGWYRLDDVEEQCLACPVGFQCVNNTLILQEGYWRMSNQSTTAVECRSTDGCVGGLGSGNSGCADGYQGPVCSVCSPGYGRFGVDCVRCGDEHANKAVLAVVVLVTCLGLYLLVRLTTELDTGKTHNGTGDHEAMGSLATVFKIYLNYLQILYYIGNMSANWSRNSITFFTVLVPVSASPSFVAVQCASGPEFTFYKRMVLIMCWPLVMGAAVGLAVSAGAAFRIWGLRKRVVLTKASYLKPLLIVLYVFMPMIANDLLRGLNCIDIKGLDGVYVADDMAVSCKTDQYRAFRVVASLYIVFYVIGGPVWIGWKMYLKRDKLEELVSLGYVSDDMDVFLYFARGYTSKALLWEGVVMFTKLAVVATSLLSDINLQLVWALMVLVVATSLTIRYDPYRTLLDNRLSIMSHWALIVSAVLAIHSLVIGKSAGVGVFVLLVFINTAATLVVLRAAWRRFVSLVRSAVSMGREVMARIGVVKEPEKEIAMYSNPSAGKSHEDLRKSLQLPEGFKY